VKLFNRGEFYRCHDVLEDMWHSAEEPVRTLLQSSVNSLFAMQRNAGNR
jgi:predicted metal-dependent hydrolase